MTANQKRALNRLRIFLNWCYDSDQDESGLIEIARKDFAFFSKYFNEKVVDNYLKLTGSHGQPYGMSDRVSLSFSIKLAETMYKKYAA